jgi:putative mycofactocin binding protein MftB
MKPMSEGKYKLTPGTQVREEDFGLLFYTMAGPRLYFMSAGDLITCAFFQGQLTLEQWIGRHVGQRAMKTTPVSDLRKSLSHLKEKGVIIEC